MVRWFSEVVVEFPLYFFLYIEKLKPIKYTAARPTTRNLLLFYTVEWLQSGSFTLTYHSIRTCTQVSSMTSPLSSKSLHYHTPPSPLTVTLVESILESFKMSAVVIQWCSDILIICMNTSRTFYFIIQNVQLPIMILLINEHKRYLYIICSYVFSPVGSHAPTNWIHVPFFDDHNFNASKTIEENYSLFFYIFLPWINKSTIVKLILVKEQCFSVHILRMMWSSLQIAGDADNITEHKELLLSLFIRILDISHQVMMRACWRKTQ